MLNTGKERLSQIQYDRSNRARCLYSPRTQANMSPRVFCLRSVGLDVGLIYNMKL